MSRSINTAFLACGNLLSPLSLSPMSLRLAIHGAAGRMGQRLVPCLRVAHSELSIVAAIDAPIAPRVGEDTSVVAGIEAIGVELSAGLEATADVA